MSVREQQIEFFLERTTVASFSYVKYPRDVAFFPLERLKVNCKVCKVQLHLKTYAV